MGAFTDNLKEIARHDVTVIAEHSVAMGLLRKPANIMDIGCLGFAFTEYFDKRGDFVVPIDIENFDSVRPYVRVAVAGYDGQCGIVRTSDKQATRKSNLVLNNESVSCYKLETLMKWSCVDYFDLIKMDCEGAEYEIIMSLTKAPAKQLSIEFHLHTGIYGMPEVKEMEDKLKSLGYRPLVHELTRQHGLPPNYWSSLWIHQ